MNIFWKKFWRGLFASAAVALMLPAASPSIAAFITGGSGGGGTPGGSDTQVQYNDAGVFGGDAGLVFNGTTNALTGTGLWTVTQGSANTGVFASTGYSLTGSNATPMIDLAGTWNTSGAPTAIKLNITNTASSGAALMDLQVDGSSRFKVSQYQVDVGASEMYIPSAGTAAGSRLGYLGLFLGTSTQISFTSGNNSGSVDAGIKRPAAGILSLVGAYDGTGAAALQFTEQTAPAAGSTNTVRIYAEDNGSGKTRLMALFPTGAAQQIAIEP